MNVQVNVATGARRINIGILLEYEMGKKIKFMLYKVENIVGKGKKCWLPAVSLFPTMFSNGFFLSVAKRRVVKS